MSQSREADDSAFVEEIRRILREAFWANDPGGPEPPEMLYHYTGPAGLTGIVQEKQLWATDYRFTNDSQELTAGEELFLGALREVAESAPDANARALLQRLSKSLEVSRPSKELDYRFFVASFAEKGNQLSQWRAYGADGIGYSLGFRRSALEAIAGHPTPGGPGAIYILQCEYDEEKFKQRVSAALRRLTPLLADWRTWLSSRCDAFLDELAPWLLLLAHSYKHEGFKEEHEWRFVCFWSKGKDSETAVQHRTTSRGPSPYVCIPLPTDERGLLRMERAYVGPRGDPEQARQGVASLLQRHGYDWQCLVKESGIPYRGSG